MAYCLTSQSCRVPIFFWVYQTVCISVKRISLRLSCLHNQNHIIRPPTNRYNAQPLPYKSPIPYLLSSSNPPPSHNIKVGFQKVVKTFTLNAPHNELFYHHRRPCFLLIIFVSFSSSISIIIKQPIEFAHKMSTTHIHTHRDIYIYIYIHACS